MNVIHPRYFVRVNNETIDQGSIRKPFVTEQAAAEFVWDDIKRGAYVTTYNDVNNIRTNWSYNHCLNAIEGRQA